MATITFEDVYTSANSTGAYDSSDTLVEEPDTRPQLSAPTFSMSGTQLTISQAESASVWYTTDGTDPIPGEQPTGEVNNNPMNFCMGIPYIDPTTPPQNVAPSEYILGTVTQICQVSKENTPVQVTNNTITGDTPVTLKGATVPDGSYYIYISNSVICLSPSRISAGHRYYYRIESTASDIFPFTINLIEGTENYYVLFNSSIEGKNVYSLIANSFFYEVEENFSTLYLPYAFISKNDSYTLETLRCYNPVIIDITANQSLFTSLGYSSEEEIKAYLDTIPYEDFNATEPMYLLPKSLSEGLPYLGEVESPTTTEGISGTADQILFNFGLASEETVEIKNGAFVVDLGMTVEGEIPPDGNYYNYATIGFVSLETSKINSSDRYYYRVESNVSDVYPTGLDYTNGGLCWLNSPEDNKTLFSHIGTSGFFIPQESTVSFAYLPYYSFSEKNTYTLETLKFFKPVVVDVTANQPFFTRLGLSSETEIKNYLDSLSYEEFGTMTSTSTTPVSNGVYYTAPINLVETLEVKAIAHDYGNTYRDSEIVEYEAVPTPEPVSGPFSVKKLSQLPFGTLTDESRILVENNGQLEQILGSEFNKETPVPEPEPEPEEPEYDMNYIKYGGYFNSIFRGFTEDGLTYFITAISSPLTKTSSSSGDWYSICLSYGSMITETAQTPSKKYIIYIDSENPLTKETSSKYSVKIDVSSEGIYSSGSTEVQNVFVFGNKIYARFHKESDSDFNLVSTTFPPTENPTWEVVLADNSFVAPLKEDNIFVFQTTTADSGIFSVSTKTLTTPITELITDTSLNGMELLISTDIIVNTSKGLAIDLQSTSPEKSGILFTPDKGETWSLYDVQDKIPYFFALNYGGGYYYRGLMSIEDPNTNITYRRSKDLIEWETLIELSLEESLTFGNNIDFGVGNEEEFFLGIKGSLSAMGSKGGERINFPPLVEISSTMNNENQLYYYEGIIYTMGYFIKSYTYSYTSSDKSPLDIIPTVVYKKLQ